MKVEKNTVVEQNEMIQEGERAGQPCIKFLSSITITLTPKEASSLLMDLRDLDPIREELITKALKNKLSALTNRIHDPSQDATC